ncbi:HlyD family type I secretion periplasmic adaptor subunit [Phormidium tenue FACHB-886]|nr:HlyD family type I secretion periplasmic adaptor subunit [Phormidium tenue FACHB-886]
MTRRWLLNPVGSFRRRYQTALDQVEQDLTSGAPGLPQPGTWTKRLTQVILISLTAGLGWSIFARIDVVIVTRGKLDPVSQSQAVQSKTSGVVAAVLVQEGDRVKQGQLLLQLDKTEMLNQLEALLLQQDQLVKEIAVLQIAQQGEPITKLQQSGARIPPELFNRVQTRMLLVAQLTGDPSNLSPEQFQRYALFEKQLIDRLSINDLQQSSLQTQVAQIEAQTAKTDFQFQVEQELLSQLQPLLQQGAISRTDFLRRAIDVNELRSQLNQSELQKQELQVSQMQSAVEGDQVIVNLYQNLQQQLAQLDAEFGATIQENQRQLVSVEAQLKQVQNTLKTLDLRSPVDGMIFDLEAKLPGAVAQSGQPLLQVVPDESLVARVQVANADIANIRVGMPVDIRVDAYPFTEFGSVKGIISKVGSEATAPSPQSAGQTFFPIEIRLDQQALSRNNEQFLLVPGMTLAANIKVRQRAPISYVSEELIKAIDSMQSVK